MASVHSMTGFASARGTSPLGAVTVEVRCVNSRFLDLAVKFPDELRAAEPVLRELLTKNIGRGKCECRVSLKLDPEAAPSSIRPEALAALKKLQGEVQALDPDARPLSVSQILGYPGIVNAPEVNQDELNASLAAALKDALTSFNASREREGAALKAVLLGYCDRIEEITRDIASRLPDILSHIKGKLTERLESALSAALTESSTLTREEVSDRIRQEVTLYALKMDVDEEINRLLTHVQEVRRVLGAGGAVGRRLDFLMQEMNREANTLGSKAAAIEMTNASVALKLVIEQMREQIQNLE